MPENIGQYVKFPKSEQGLTIYTMLEKDNQGCSCKAEKL